MKVVFWVGATGTGKSDLALTNAEKFSADIINADSIQMYRKVDLGSAKPTAAEFQRRPHHLFDFVSPPDTVTAGDFNRMFFERMRSQAQQAGPQFVVGGTGFYFQAIEKGILEIPKTNPETQKRLELELQQPGGEQRLHDQLKAADPVAAARIHARDHYRMVRALDVIDATGRPVTDLLAEHKATAPAFPFPLLKIGLKLERAELEARLQLRTETMLASGWLQEVQSLMDQGLADWEPVKSVGYRECVQFLRHEIATVAELKAKIVHETMRLAKKQRTWFQRDPEIRWFHPSQKSEIHDVLVGFLQD